MTGERISLEDFAGSLVVINVWASWCPGCNDEAADLKAFADRHPEVAVLGVDFQDPLNDARDFYRRWGWEHPSIVDLAGTATGALGLVGLPTTVFLDARHQVAARLIGAGDFASFEEGLRLALVQDG